LFSLFDIVLILAVTLSAFFDIKERRIPNWVSLPGILMGLLLNSFLGVAQLLHSVTGLLAGIGVMIIPFALRWMGAGDVKLFGLVGALLGVQWLPRVFFYSGLIGGILALFSVVIRGLSFNSFAGLWLDLKVAVMTLGRVLPESLTQGTIQRRNSIPFGVAIGFGTLAAFYFDPNGRWAGF
jgi:prepilin peptidase CpaA